MKKLFIFIIAFAIVTSCSNSGEQTNQNQSLDEFLKNIEKEDELLNPIIYSASWISSNFITHDSQLILSDYSKRSTLVDLQRSKDASTYEVSKATAEQARKLNILKSAFVMPPPLDNELASELSKIETKLSAMYGSATHCFSEDDCNDLEGFENIIDNSRDPIELKRAWEGWHEIGKPMKGPYMRMIQIGNEGAKELGYSDLSDLWFSKYDMPSEDFLTSLDEAWEEVKPLYDALHCHARDMLNQEYGNEIIDPKGPIPVHLLGNMWGQSWSNIFDIVYKTEKSEKKVDVTQIILEKDLSEIEMVEIAEDFFLSIGFDPLPKTFWERSLFVKPQDRSVVCHASAWNLDPSNNDLRIKMCIERNEEDFSTIHHELGHIFYYQAYNHLPSLFRSGANDGFHEAFGDLLTLSITPDYLKQIGFINENQAMQAKEDEIGLLMKQALEGVVVVPWALMLDKWRADIFKGETSFDELNDSWWKLRNSYQGIAPPSKRKTDSFDPGAKYHIPANTPYTRYYLARIMQYQFHEALCQSAGFEGPLHECSIYGNKEAGNKIISTMALGKSVPWQEAFKEITGTEKLSGESIMNYYKPLKKWLDEQNKERLCGWSTS